MAKRPTRTKAAAWGTAAENALLTNAAARAIRERPVIPLSVLDQEAFARALTEPPTPGPRLRTAASRCRTGRAS